MSAPDRLALLRALSQVKSSNRTWDIRKHQLVHYTGIFSTNQFSCDVFTDVARTKSIEACHKVQQWRSLRAPCLTVEKKKRKVFISEMYFNRVWGLACKIHLNGDRSIFSHFIRYYIAVTRVSDLFPFERFTPMLPLLRIGSSFSGLKQMSDPLIFCLFWREKRSQRSVIGSSWGVKKRKPFMEPHMIHREREKKRSWNSVHHIVTTRYIFDLEIPSVKPTFINH